MKVEFESPEVVEQESDNFSEALGFSKEEVSVQCEEMAGVSVELLAERDNSRAHRVLKLIRAARKITQAIPEDAPITKYEVLIATLNVLFQNVVSGLNSEK